MHARTHARTHNSTPGSMAGRPHKQRLGTRRCVAAGGLTCGAAANGWNSAAATGRSTPAVTLPQLPELLREAVGQQIDLDAPLMGTGISSRAALKLMSDLQRLADHLVSISGQIASLLSDLDNRPASMRSQPCWRLARLTQTLTKSLPFRKPGWARAECPNDAHLRVPNRACGRLLLRGSSEPGPRSVCWTK